jgi:glutathione S-transferase
MYTLHIANKNYASWSLRPWLLLTQLRIPFEESLHPFMAGSNHDAFMVFSPTGKVPCLHVGEARIWDSLAITEYLAERHEGVWPKDGAARAWARCAAAEMHSGFAALRAQCPMSCGVRVVIDAPSATLLADVARVDALWCEGLQRFGGPFLAGDTFTAVDAFYAPVVFRAQTYGLSLSRQAEDYAARMLGLAGMQQWYAAAVSEPLREPAHDAECLRHGRLEADLRVPA